MVSVSPASGSVSRNLVCINCIFIDRSDRRTGKGWTIVGVAHVDREDLVDTRRPIIDIQGYIVDPHIALAGVPVNARRAIAVVSQSQPVRLDRGGDGEDGASIRIASCDVVGIKRIFCAAVTGVLVKDGASLVLATAMLKG